MDEWRVVMGEFIIKYWVQVAMGLIVAALGAIGRWIGRQVKGQKTIKNGLKALLRNEIYNNHNRCIEKGYCPLWQRENVDEMYTQYKALGGNGTVPNLVEELRDMPTKERKGNEKKNDEGKEAVISG